MSRLNGFVGRRDLLKMLGVGGASVAASAAGATIWTAQQALDPQAAAADEKQAERTPVNPDEALKRLVDGNKRFAQQKPLYPGQTLERLQTVAKAQYPFASILGCADSRVPSEIVFDQGLGDLFVVRMAGNVVSPTTIGSLEFATAVLGSQLIVVLGHRKCGAVAAAVKGDPLPGRIGTFVEDIKPAVDRIRNKSGDINENAVVANVQYQVEILKETSSILSQLIRDGKLKIVGGSYNLDNGRVDMLA